MKKKFVLMALVFLLTSLSGVVEAAANQDAQAANKSDAAQYQRVKDTDLSGKTYDGYYLHTDKKLHTISNKSFKVVAYKVKKNTVYKLYATGTRINADLPLVGFGTKTIGHLVSYNKIIIKGSATPKNIDVEYTPKSNGYIYIACYENYPRVAVATTILDKIKDSGDEKTLKPKETLKIQLFGDSITDNLWGDKATWANLIPDYISERDVTVVNCAVGGSGIGHGKSTTTPSQQDKTYNYVYDLVTDGVTLETDSDVIVILTGTNDWASSSISIGTSDDSGNDTLYGCLKDIIKYISSNTNAKLIICTPPQRYNSVDQTRNVNANEEPINDKGFSLREFCDPYLVMCEFYSIPCIDLNKDLGWNQINIAKFSNDNLHPNSEGDKLIARLICNAIKTYMVID